MADRMATCAWCGAQFVFESNRAHGTKYCGKSCSKAAKVQRLAEAAKSAKICSVDGCEDRVRSGRAEFCEKHYMRLRRHGAVSKFFEVNAPKPEMPHTSGYVLEYLPSHPLWGRTSGRLYQHRRVFFDAFGEGPFDCHWCGNSLDWGTMHVDHLNAVRDDNRIENLVAACPKCNQKRGFEKGKITHRKRSSARIEWRGKTICVSEAAEMIGISVQSVRWRMQNGWDVERIMTEPRGITGPQSMERRGQA